VTPAAWLVARRALLDRPWRSALLLLGYGVGVAIMIALLSVGDALLLEAKDRNLVAGGDVAVLPEGIDPAVIKVNGVTGMFLTVPNAGFLVRDVIEGPRFRREVIAAAPQLSSRLLYVRAHGRVVTAGASAGIPSLDRAAHAARAVTGGTDSAADTAWLQPSAAALADRLDRFHVPPAPRLARAAWVEWDYFTVFDPATRGYAYLTLIAGADPVGAVLARVRMPGLPVQDVVIPAVIGPADLSTAGAEQRVGPARVSVDAGGYRVTVDDPRLRAAFTIRPDPGFVLPATELRQGDAVTGYVVPVVRGRATGWIRAGGRTLTLSNAPAYHDHNWGTWRGVTWDWGQASSDAGALVYASVHLPKGESPDAGGPAVRSGTGHRDIRAAGNDVTNTGGPQPTLFLWGQGGLVAALPVASVAYGGWRPGPRVAGRAVPAPSEVTIQARSGSDTVTVRVAIRDVLGSLPLGAPAGRQAAGNGTTATPRPAIPVFLQLRGDAAVRGTVGGAPVAWNGPAASETFVRP
jgi:tocopherol cyclase-like protein